MLCTLDLYHVFLLLLSFINCYVPVSNYVLKFQSLVNTLCESYLRGLKTQTTPSQTLHALRHRLPGDHCGKVAVIPRHLWLALVVREEQRSSRAAVSALDVAPVEGAAGDGSPPTCQTKATIV